MRHRYLYLGIASLLLAGCGSGSSSDPVAAQRAATAAPTSAAALPGDMPPEARASAAAAIGQAEEQKRMNSDPARLHAMEMMKKQHGG